MDRRGPPSIADGAVDEEAAVVEVALSEVGTLLCLFLLRRTEGMAAVDEEAGASNNRSAGTVEESNGETRSFEELGGAAETGVTSVDRSNSCPSSSSMSVSGSSLSLSSRSFIRSLSPRL